MSKIEYRIHPSVGIARMGDSTSSFFVGPEEIVDAFRPTLRQIPGSNEPFLGVQSVRDPDGRIAKQAARFRVFAYEYDQPLGKRARYPRKVWQVTADDAEITWRVQVANRKARNSTPYGDPIPNTPGEYVLNRDDRNPRVMQIDGRLALGSVFVEEDCALLVLGSAGAQRRIPGAAAGDESDLRWVNWEDDAADGYVQATVRVGQQESAARPSWVVIAMPDYAADLREAVSLYDVALNHAMLNARRNGLNRTYFDKKITFEKHIKPTIDVYTQLPWVSASIMDARREGKVAHVYGPGVPVTTLLNRLRPPPTADRYVPERYFPADSQLLSRGSYPGPGVTFPSLNMPLEPMTFPGYFTLPRLVYGWLSDWEKMKDDEKPAADPWVHASDLDWPQILDVAQMRSMAGGTFFPGLEVGRAAAMWQHWQADHGAKRGHVDVRVTADVGYLHRVEPGDLTDELSCPWQLDFYRCGDDWWPASRPNRTTRVGEQGVQEIVEWVAPIGSGDRLRERWTKLGFVRKVDNEYVEQEYVMEGR